MTSKDTVEMIDRCVEEIDRLRAQIDRLAPKAEAYDQLKAVLDLLPKAQQGYAPDIVWQLKKQRSEIEASIGCAKPGAANLSEQ